MAVQSEKRSIIDISIPSDFVLTPLSCAFLINEILKDLLYQKAQIPYPYSWLKSVVNKKRKSKDETHHNTHSFTVHKHFQTVSKTYDSLEKIMNNLNEMFSGVGNNIKEIVIVFGVTPLCPNEVLTIKVSSLAKGHVEKNHTLEMRNKQHKIIRDIFLSQQWMDLINSSLSCTNTYIFIKQTCSYQAIPSGNVFIPSKPLYLAPKVKHTVLNLNYTQPLIRTCCDDWNIFCEDSEIPQGIMYNKSEYAGLEQNPDELWSQSQILIPGFKDLFINKISACQLW